MSCVLSRDVMSCHVISPHDSGNTLVTGSGDKTVSLLDMRTALCVQTFYGHGNTVLDASFNIKADTIVTSDADGVVKVG